MPYTRLGRGIFEGDDLGIFQHSAKQCSDWLLTSGFSQLLSILGKAAALGNPVHIL